MNVEAVRPWVIPIKHYDFACAIPAHAKHAFEHATNLHALPYRAAWRAWLTDDLRYLYTDAETPRTAGTSIPCTIEVHRLRLPGIRPMRAGDSVWFTSMGPTHGGHSRKIGTEWEHGQLGVMGAVASATPIWQVYDADGTGHARYDDELRLFVRDSPPALHPFADRMRKRRLGAIG